jgi:amino acid permease
MIEERGEEIKEPFLVKMGDHKECFENYSPSDELFCKFEKAEECQRYYYKLSRGSLIGSVSTLLCLTFGSGILALPYTFKKVGIILGFLLFLISAKLVYMTMGLIIKVGYKHNILDYTSLVHKFFGPKIVMLTSVFNLISNFGGIVVYQQIITNFFISFLKFCKFWLVYEHYELSRFVITFGFTILTQIPLSLVKDIRILHKAATIGTCALIYVVLVSFIEFPSYFKQNYPTAEIRYWKFNSNIFKVVCMYIFAFNNHFAILNVVRQLVNPTKERARQTVRTAFFIEFIVYICVLFTAYFSTFQDTNEVFVDRADQSIFILIGKLGYIVSLTCHIALYYYISRPSLEVFLNNGEEFSTSG